MYLGHSFRLEYLHFGTGDLEKRNLGWNERELSIRNLGNQSMECVATLVTQLVLTRVESKTVMACTKGTPSGECTYIPEMIALISWWQIREKTKKENNEQWLYLEKHWMNGLPSTWNRQKKKAPAYMQTRHKLLYMHVRQIRHKKSPPHVPKMEKVLSETDYKT